MKKVRWYWHVHHEVLVEPSENINERIDYIKTRKPSSEIQTRLQLLKEVKGKLPPALLSAGEAYDKAWEAYDKAGKAYDKAREAYSKIWEAYDKAWEAYDKAGKAYDKARKAYSKAREKYKPQVEALHAKECPDCPWNGKTIFPEE